MKVEIDMMRSSRVEIRNPILTLPSIAGLQALPKDQRELIASLLTDLSTDAAARAEVSWRSSKGPMAAYWKATSVYAKHIRAAIRKGRN